MVDLPLLLNPVDMQHHVFVFLTVLNSIGAKSVLAGEKLVATYSIST